MEVTGTKCQHLNVVRMHRFFIGIVDPFVHGTVFPQTVRLFDIEIADVPSFPVQYHVGSPAHREPLIVQPHQTVVRRPCMVSLYSQLVLEKQSGIVEKAIGLMAIFGQCLINIGAGVLMFMMPYQGLQVFAFGGHVLICLPALVVPPMLLVCRVASERLLGEGPKAKKK